MMCTFHDHLFIPGKTEFDKNIFTTAYIRIVINDEHFLTFIIKKCYQFAIVIKDI